MSQENRVAVTSNGAAPLIIGYGNSLRTDDGIGWHVAGALLNDSRFAHCRVLQVFQLAPELSCDMAEASRVVLIDAKEDHESPEGTVTTRDVYPTAQTDGISSHHVTPEAMVSLTHDLCGHVPPVVAVEVATRHFDEGDVLTEPIRNAMRAITEAVYGFVRSP